MVGRLRIVFLKEDEEMPEETRELIVTIQGLTRECRKLRGGLSRLRRQQAVISDRVKLLQRVVYGIIAATFVQFLNVLMH